MTTDFYAQLAGALDAKHTDRQWQAYQRGRYHEDNPFTRGTDEHAACLLGLEAAQDRREVATLHKQLAEAQARLERLMSAAMDVERALVGGDE